MRITDKVTVVRYMKTHNVKDVDDMKTLGLRFKLITLEKYRDRNKIKRASEEIDKIRV